MNYLPKLNAANIRQVVLIMGALAVYQYVAAPQIEKARATARIAA